MEAITIGTTWLQSVSLLYRTYKVSSKSTDWPSFLSSPIVAFVVENVFLLSVEDLQNLPWDSVTRYTQYLALGFRSSYIVTNLLFPLALCFTAVALFKPLPTLLAYTSFLLSLCLFSSFVYMILLQQSNLTRNQYLKSIHIMGNSYINEWYFLMGAIIFFFVSLAFGAASVLEWRFGIWRRLPNMADLAQRFVNILKLKGKVLLGMGPREENKPSWKLMGSISAVQRRRGDRLGIRRGVAPVDEVRLVTVQPATFSRAHNPNSLSPSSLSPSASPMSPTSPGGTNVRITSVPLREQREELMPKTFKKGYMVTKVDQTYDEFQVTTYKERPINELKEQRRLAHRFNCYRVTMALIIVTLILGTGLILMTVVREYITGGLCLALVLGVFVFYMPLLLLRRGRALIFWIRYQVLEKWAVFFLLILVQILFTPFMTAIFDSFACQTMTCPRGTRFVSLYNGISLDTIYNRKTDVYCEPCLFYSPLSGNNSVSINSTSQLLNATCPILSDLCTETSRSRLVDDPSLDCRMDMMTYFWPASLLTGILYAVALPVLYFLLIQRSLTILKRMDVNSLLWKNLPDHIKQEAKKLNFRNFLKHEIKKMVNFFVEKITRKKKKHKSQIGLWAPELHSKLKHSPTLGSIFSTPRTGPRSKAVVVPKSDADIEVSGGNDIHDKYHDESSHHSKRRHHTPPMHTSDI
mmetsp:Transcript_1937/g.6948  ORF Transcript_1937/g.6948 Transcript_1937/m.6948 type:complete len:693 (-) Transcript_1937:2016-4094(-)